MLLAFKFFSCAWICLKKKKSSLYTFLKKYVFYFYAFWEICYFGKKKASFKATVINPKHQSDNAH